MWESESSGLNQQCKLETPYKMHPYRFAIYIYEFNFEVFSKLINSMGKQFVIAYDQAATLPMPVSGGILDYSIVYI